MNEVCGALEKWVVKNLPGFHRAVGIHVVGREECSLGLTIRDRQISFRNHTCRLHAALMQSQILSDGDMDRLQEVASTNVVHLDDSHSFFRILPGRPFWPRQTQYFSIIQSTGPHQDEYLAEAKEPHQNSCLLYTSDAADE